VADDPLGGDRRKATHDLAGECGQAPILGGGERRLIRALELDADAVVVALAFAVPARAPGMPSPLPEIDELHRLAVAADEQMRGDGIAGDGREIGVRVGVELSAEELLHPGPAECPRRQGNVVDDQQVDHGARRTRVAVR